MKVRGAAFFAGAVLTCSTALAQPDLLDVLNEGVEAPTTPVSATFKDTRVINVQSNETAASGVLHFVIAHRFGRLNEGAYALWGLDNASMRMSFDYGLTDRLQVGLGRSTLGKTYEASAKLRVLRQTTGGRNFPIGLTLFSSAFCTGIRWADPDRTNYVSSRLSFVHQAIFSRKFNDDFSVVVVPSMTHRNLVPTPDVAHDVYTVGLGGRYKLNSRFSINGEVHAFASGRTASMQPSMSIGCDIETGGHVFQLHLTNSSGMFESAFLTETTGTWGAGDIYFGFNLSRVFTVRERNRS
jgi:hypothetical protein